MLTNRFKNRIGRLLYRPGKKRRRGQVDNGVTSRLEEVEGTLLSLLGKKRGKAKK